MSKAKTCLTALKAAVESSDAKELAGALGDCLHLVKEKAATPKAATARSDADAAACSVLCDEITAACAAGEPTVEEGTVGAIAWSDLFKKLVAQLPAIIAIFRDIFG